MKCDKIRQVLQPESFVLGCNLPLFIVLKGACNRNHAHPSTIFRVEFGNVMFVNGDAPESRESKPGCRVAGPFWAQAVNQKRQYLQIRIYKSLHFRPCRSCRKSQKVPTMFFCPVRIPSNARVVCSDRRL